MLGWIGSRETFGVGFTETAESCKLIFEGSVVGRVARNGTVGRVAAVGSIVCVGTDAGVVRTDEEGAIDAPVPAAISAAKPMITVMAEATVFTLDIQPNPLCTYGLTHRRLLIVFMTQRSRAHLQTPESDLHDITLAGWAYKLLNDYSDSSEKE